MDILCFSTTKETHNISIFIEVFAREKSLPDVVEGLPCVNVDIVDGKIYTSVGLAKGLAKKADYWGEGTAEQLPYQVKQHMLTKRVLLCEPDDPMLPVTEDGDPIPVEDLLEDNSELMQIIWQQLISNITA